MGGGPDVAGAGAGSDGSARVGGGPTGFGSSGGSLPLSSHILRVSS